MDNALALFNDGFDDFDDFGKSFFPSLFGGWKRRSVGPKVNVRKTDAEYDIEIAAPGSKKGDFDISLDGDALTVRYGKSEEKSDKDSDGNYLRREWSSGEFSETWTLPDDVVAKGIAASAENGVLTVKLPRVAAKPEIEKKRVIEIQ